MAGDWIKMRGGLFNSPKLIAMGRALHAERAFRDWLTPGGGGPLNGQIVSDHALRCVTGALLCVTWSWSREFGKALPSGDCLLPQIGIDDIDGIAGAPTVGAAMQAVGWAVYSDDPVGVILPKFFTQHNVPLTPAEKQRAYRERKRIAKSVTETLPARGNKTVTREEKRREEKSNKEPSTTLRSVEGSSEPSRASEPPVPPEPPPDEGFLTFPCCGRDAPTWTLTRAKVAEYRESFPGIDVEAECRKALQWCRDNRLKRKTARGMPAFLGRWLAKEQDRAGGRSGPGPPQGARPTTDVKGWLERNPEEPTE